MYVLKRPEIGHTARSRCSGWNCWLRWPALRFSFGFSTGTIPEYSQFYLYAFLWSWLSIRFRATRVDYATIMPGTIRSSYHGGGSRKFNPVFEAVCDSHRRHNRGIWVDFMPAVGRKMQYWQHCGYKKIEQWSIIMGFMAFICLPFWLLYHFIIGGLIDGAARSRFINSCRHSGWVNSQ
jgi:hypothetical protein